MMKALLLTAWTILVCLFLSQPVRAAEAPDDAQSAGSVASSFLNAYIKALPSFQGPMGAVSWVEKSPLATSGFKKRLAELYRKAWKDDPEVGYGADAILGAQDYPDSFKPRKVRVEGNHANVLMTGSQPFPMEVRMELVRRDGKWLVDGSGDLLSKKE